MEVVSTLQAELRHKEHSTLSPNQNYNLSVINESQAQKCEKNPTLIFLRC